MRAEAKTSTGQEDVAEPRLPIRKMSKGPQNGNSSSNESSLSMPSPPKVVGKLRVQVIGAQNLAAQDRNGFSDPFIIINLPGAPPPSTSSSSKKDKDFYRRRTPHQPKTLAPKWKESEGTFEWNITTDWYQSAAEADGKTGSESPEQVVKEKIKLVDTSAGYSESPQTEVNADPLQVAGSRLQAQPTSHRPSNVRKLSAATGKILSASVRAPVRMTAKGAVATTRAVRKRGPRRPMRIRKGSKSSIIDDSILHQASVGAIEFVVWDKDKWSGNDYMGECSLQVGSWIAEGKSAVWEASEPMTLPLVSSRRNAKVSGEIIVRVGLISEGTREADDIYSHLVMASNSGIRSVPADQSVGTTGPSEAFIDYGSSSESEAEAMEELDSDGDSSDNESGDDETTTTELEDDYLEVDTASGSIPVITTSAEPDDDSREQETVARSRPKRYLLPRRLRRSPSAVDTSTASDAGDEHPSPAIKPKKIRVRVRRKRRPDRTESTDSQDQQSQTKRKQRLRRKQKEDFAFQPELGMDIIGIVQMEVKGAHDLPRWKNSLGTGFDMDPFVIVSFGQRIFRTRVARHSLNPTWDEKLLFRVRQHESNFVTKLAIYDWDKLSANDFVGSSEIKISELIEAAPKPDAQSGLYGIDEDGQHAMKVFQLPLARNERPEDSRNLGKHPPILTIEAKFTPYDSLRQRFWRQLLTQYDTNDSGTLNNLELSSMLDSLGSTLTSKTIQGLFSQFGKKGDDGDELTVNEAIVALEKELSKPWAEKRYVDRSWEATPGGSGSQTPAMMDVVTNQLMGYVGPHAPLVGEGKLAENKAVVPASAIDEQEYSTDEKSAAPLSDDANLPEELNALSVGKQPKRHDSTKSTSTGSSNPSLSAVVPEAEGEEQEEQQVERVIVLKSCPLCHMPRLSKKAEMDIVTHLAVCASQDWRRVDSMVVNNFVTASQAHRKWYTKVITKISQGQYQLGAHSANIIVQDRMTGELLEEKMQVYVRLGMRLLYNAARSRMEGARVKKMLRNMSVKQGVKFDSPASAREIPQFIAFHNLSLHEIAEPIESFKTFNQFFYRKLKEGVRPISDPDDATTLVSSADCRLMAFSSITEATKVWIKGREFTVERLLGDKYKKGASRDGGSLVIFRLAPQDYHRFHCPANAVVVDITMIHGQYYTVNPMAIRSAIDVYGENIRAVVEFKSQEFGTFYCVCIGAMMVGSIHLSVRKGDTVKRGDEMGYYAFGGSTNVCIFEQGRVAFDDDLLANSRTATETLVRVNTRIGKSISTSTE